MGVILGKRLAGDSRFREIQFTDDLPEIQILDSTSFTDPTSNAPLELPEPVPLPTRIMQMQFDATNFGAGAIVGGAMSGTATGTLFGGAVGYIVGRRRWQQDQR